MPMLPRLEFDELPSSLAAALQPRVKRLGYLGEFFKCAAHQPQALEAFIEFTESAKQGLPKQLTELIALTVASWMGNAYERNQHERLSRRLGFERSWIEVVNSLRPESATRFNDQERRVQFFILRALANQGHASRERFEALVDEFGPQKAVAVLMVLARYAAHALIVNTLGLAPPVPSIFEDGFEP
jgi:alkylhydroperoxidase family enzyme